MILREKAGEPSAGAPDVVARDEAGAKQAHERVLRCGRCGHAIADPDDAVEVAGRHHHTCVNPAGVTYRIACFAAAAGCIGEGEWTDFYSWFAGYSWQIALCAACGQHLGWRFSSPAAPSFAALVTNRLVSRLGSGR